MAGEDEGRITSPPPPSTKLDITSPFYLGTGDRPGDFITPTRLTHNNYDEWSADIRLALEARRKYGFLDGTSTSAVPPYTDADWTTVNAMLVYWIFNTIDPEVKGTLTKYREASRLWEHLKTRFSTVNGPRIQQLRSSIARCEQTKTMSVSTYYGKLNSLWEDLFHLVPLISRSCCANCNAGSLHESRRETEKLHDFLMGLYSDYYSRLRTQILSMDPLPSLDRAYQLVA